MGSQRGCAIAVLTGQQDRLVARDQRLAEGFPLFRDASTTGLDRPVSPDDGQILILAGRGIQLRYVTGFAGQGARMLFFIGQPIVGGFDTMARFAAAQRVIQLGGHSPLGALALGELVQRPVKILTQVNAPGIENQVVGPAFLGFPVVYRVIQSVMAIRAADDPFCMDVPGPVQRPFIGQVDAGIGQDLGRIDLPRGQCAPLGWLAAVGHQGSLGFNMNQTVALTTILVGRVLDQVVFFE